MMDVARSRPGFSPVGFTARALSVAIGVAAAGCDRTEGVRAPPVVEGVSEIFSFSAAVAGGLPPEWKAEQTGGGEGSIWRVVADGSSVSSSGYVLAQKAKSPRSTYNLCVVVGRRLRDLELTVACKAMAGDVDQGGGLVWRYVDANNYYVSRFNPLEGNLRIYKVVAGERSTLASVDVRLPAGVWHTITAAMKGDLIVCGIGGTRVSARDHALTEAGHVGLWTKADAQSRFDRLTVKGRRVE